MTHSPESQPGGGSPRPSLESARIDEAIDAVYRAMPMPCPPDHLADKIMAAVRDEAASAAGRVGVVIAPRAESPWRIDVALALGLVLGVTMMLALFLIEPAVNVSSAAALAGEVWDGAAAIAQWLAVDWTAGMRAVGMAADAMPSSSMLAAMLMALSGLWWTLNMWTARCAQQHD